ncbi:DUF2254 domain-containing protein [Flavobacteriaceae bacterium KMM 6897]|nr:DUF2254 domain-containing protein [Flavobacteriaceae bacterium KMM 6897]MEB8344436.1 DUF2254 domain-containing protein [Flavobacteriaceae bacterium KMM 6898]
MKRLFFIWDELQSSFWFIPILIISMSIGAAIGLLYLDNTFNYQPSTSGILRFIFSGSVDSARSVLSIISAAMIGVAGTVFSITLVALTLASSQFGSRLLRNFMHERINQIVLGTYIATYVYCLLVLNAVKGTEQFSFIPSFSVLVAILATIANIILLIIFIHHIAISIQANKVISDISESLSKNLKQFFPEEIGMEPAENEVPDIEILKKTFPIKKIITSPKSGYILYADNEGIFDLAKENKLLVFLNYRPGDYVVEHMEIGEVYSHGELDDDDFNDFQNVFILGKSRTSQQDPEFSIHQMVEIAGRALSPGINDPYTAITCIDNLTSTLCYLTNVKFPSKFRYDENNELRVVASNLTFKGMLNVAFNQIRQFAGGSPAVVIRLMEALIIINSLAKTNTQKKALQEHARMVLRVAEKFFVEEKDLNDMKERSNLILGQ